MQYRNDKYGNPLSILGYGCMRFTRKGNGIDIDKAENLHEQNVLPGHGQTAVRVWDHPCQAARPVCTASFDPEQTVRIQRYDQGAALDGHFVPEISFGEGITRTIRPFTDQILDVHMMVTNPESHIESFAKAGADSITFHYEVMPGGNSEYPNAYYRAAGGSRHSSPWTGSAHIQTARGRFHILRTGWGRAAL